MTQKTQHTQKLQEGKGLPSKAGSDIFSTGLSIRYSITFSSLYKIIPAGKEYQNSGIHYWPLLPTPQGVLRPGLINSKTKVQ